MSKNRNRPRKEDIEDGDSDIRPAVCQLEVKLEREYLVLERYRTSGMSEKYHEVLDRIIDLQIRHFALTGENYINYQRRVQEEQRDKKRSDY